MPSSVLRMPGNRGAHFGWRWPLATGLLLALCLDGAAQAAVIKVACIGDSITAGAGASDANTTSYPARLGVLLGTANYTTVNFGVSGTTMLKNGDFTYWGTSSFTPDSDAFAPDLVVIMLGTNDSKSQNWGPHKDEYVGDYEAMIDHYRALPSQPLVFICTLCPVYGAGNFGITDPVVENEIIPRIRQVALAKSTPVIEVNAAMAGVPGDFPDNVHPNDAGYVLLAQAVYRAIHPPAAASALSVTAVMAGRVNLAWTDNADNETGFAVERKTGAGGTYAVIATAAANATAFSDTSVTGLTTYYYRVRALNAAGSGAFTNEVNATTPAAPPSSAHHCGHGGLFGFLLLTVTGMLRWRGMRADAKNR